MEAPSSPTKLLMSENRKRRRLRFSMRTLFVFVIVLGMCLGWIGWNVRQIRARKEIISYYRRGAGDSGRFESARELPLLWRLMGESHHWFDIELPQGKFTEADRSRLQSLFPEVDVILVDRAPRMVPNPDDVDYAEAHWDD